MFLDDELLEIVKEAVSDTKLTAIEVNIIFADKLYSDVIQKCKTKLIDDLNNTREIAVIQASIKRLFTSYDLFVTKAKNDSNKNIKQVGFLFEKYPLKDEILSIPPVAEIYYHKRLSIKNL